jgi:signal transduction histidine kinase
VVGVHDQGMGIPEGELEAIFDQFVQSSRTKTGAGGTGLGLAICREIVTAHQGRIWAENRPTGGAALFVALPRRLPDEADAAPMDGAAGDTQPHDRALLGHERSRGMSRHSRILIVDDNPTNIAILEEILGDHYVLKTATYGEEALARAPEFQPALILLDIMMPGIDGYETCRRLRGHPTLRHTKIIMVSAKALVTERLQGYEVWADDYLTKPFDEEELLAKVRVYLRLKSVEEVDQLKSDVLALLSHETRTPLNGIMAPVEMVLAEDDMAAADRTMLLNLVQQSAQHLLNLFAHISKLSQMKAGQWDFEFTAGDLCDVVRDAVVHVISAAAQRGVQIARDLPEVAPTWLDWQQMIAVVTTLLDNAIRFSPSPGRVVVKVASDDQRICVMVTDQGPGIDPDFLPYVFEPLAQPDVRHHTEGQGLSLAIAHHIVLAHHGGIGVESTKGGGTTFTVWVPTTMGAGRSGPPP